MPGFRGFEMYLMEFHSQCAPHWWRLLLFVGFAGTAPALPSDDNLPVGQGLQGGAHVTGVPQVLHAREAYRQHGGEGLRGLSREEPSQVSPLSSLVGPQSY